jgi:hypothetical protein
MSISTEATTPAAAFVDFAKEALTAAEKRAHGARMAFEDACKGNPAALEAGREWVMEVTGWLHAAADGITEKLEERACQMEIGMLTAQDRARTLQTMLDADRAAQEARYAEVAAEEERKALPRLYRFPEAGEGRWTLKVIYEAFDVAKERHGLRDLHRQADSRVTLSNRRLVRMVGGYGQMISSGNGKRSVRVYFAREIVAAVVDILRRQPSTAA